MSSIHPENDGPHTAVAELIERIGKIHDINGFEGANEKACLRLIGTGWESYMSPVAKLGCTRFFDKTPGLSWGNFTELRNKLFMELAKDYRDWVRRHIAANPHCPPETLANLAKDQEKEVRKIVAENPHCPSEALTKLAKDQYKNIRENVANHPNCPPETLARLAKDEDLFVQGSVAENPHCPPEALSNLAKNGWGFVVGNIVKNPNCPPDVLAKLGKTSEEIMGLRLAQDPQCPPASLTELAENGPGSILRQVIQNPRCSPELLIKLAKSRGGISEDLAKNPNCPPEVLIILAKEKSDYLRYILAKHPNSPPEVLTKLANSKDALMRWYVADNPGCPPEALTRLARSSDRDIRESVAANPQCPTELLIKWANSQDKYLRLCAAANPNCPQDVLIRLAHESFYSIRIAAIGNPSYPAERREADAQELSAYILSWFDKTKKPLTTELSSQDLVELKGILGPKPKKTAAPIPPRRLTTLKLNKSNVLVGNYPKVLDLRNHEYELPNILIHSDDEYKRAIKKGRPPQASIHVCGKKSVEVIYFPSDRIGHDYAVIENLPNLKELHICRADWRDELKWLICRNLPNLKTITVEGGVFWLQLENLASLESIDASKCSPLDYFSIKHAPVLKKVNVKNCNKLRKIADMPDDEQISLGISKQIQENQKASKNNGKIYKNMTFTDVDTVLANINNAVKIATRKGLFPVEDDDTNFCYGRENDPDFASFSFVLLRPLESVYTGGTGETYAYATWVNDYNEERGRYGICLEIGNSNQESCLEEALHHIDMGDLVVPGKPKASEQQILDYLNKLVTDEK